MNFKFQFGALRGSSQLESVANCAGKVRDRNTRASLSAKCGAEICAALLLFLANLTALAQPPVKQYAPAQTPREPSTALVTDEMGRSVRVPVEARRIVSLAPNLTETVFALGKGDFLYGDTDFCDFPPEAKQKTHIGGPVNPNLEQIVSLRPDLVLATKLINRRETVDALTHLGIPVYVTDPHTVDEMISSTERLGALLHAEAVAAPLAENLRARLADIDRRVAVAAPSRVLFVVWTDPLISIGRNTFLTDALRHAGAQSVVDTAAEWPRVSLEAAASLKPESLVFSYAHADEAKHDIDALRDKPGWRDLEAFKRGKIIVIGDAINRPAPRMIDAIEQLARALHPDAFAAIQTRRVENLVAENVLSIQQSNLYAAQVPKSLREDSDLGGFCSVGLQADIADSRTCPPEGGRYKEPNQAFNQEPKPLSSTTLMSRLMVPVFSPQEPRPTIIFYGATPTNSDDSPVNDFDGYRTPPPVAMEDCACVR